MKVFVFLRRVLCVPIFMLIGDLASAEITAASAKVILNGQFQQGGTVFGQVAPGTQIKIENRNIKVTPKGDFVFGFGHDSPQKIKLTHIDSKGQSQSQWLSVEKRRYNTQRVNGVEPKHVNPPKEVLERINRENQLIGQARRRNDAREDFLQTFKWPLIGPITGVYGSYRIFNGVPKAPHFGLDIAGPLGAKVVAPAGGIVTLAEPDLFYSGGTLIVDHGHGFSSTFIHLSKLLVNVGNRVEQGDRIAEVGATGRVTGPHLDWRINWFDVRLDPALLMKDKPMPQSLTHNKGTP